MERKEKQGKFKQHIRTYIYYYIAGIVTLLFVLYFFRFPMSIGRLIESLCDVGNSIGYTFAELFHIEHKIIPTVNNFAKIPYFKGLDNITPKAFIPPTWSEFKTAWVEYWHRFVDIENLGGYVKLLIKIAFIIVAVLPWLEVFVITIMLLSKRYMAKTNTDRNVETKPLKIYKWLALHIFSPTIRFIGGFIRFVKERPILWKCWFALWLFYFNVIQMIIEFIAWLLYLMVSYDVVSAYRQVYKLSLDLYPVLDFMPVIGWIIICIVLFCRWSKNYGYARLMRFYNRNRGLVNSLPIVCFLVNTMGSGKTRGMTIIGRVKAVNMRDKAFEKILENDLKFPNFPWQNFEDELRMAMEYHEVYTLATVRLWVWKKYRRWLKHCLSERRLWGYDYSRYGITYDDKLSVKNLWEVLETYAQLYFIYVLSSSLLLATYGVCSDSVMRDMGNFPLWDHNPFTRDSRTIEQTTTYAHILPFDALRLGLKMIENNPYQDFFEFGVILFDEAGKDRGNQIENKEYKKTDKTANPLTDGFNDRVKMIRHPATVDNTCYVFALLADQRPESVGADLRDLCTIVRMGDCGDKEILLPFVSVLEMLYACTLQRFSDFYYTYRFQRGDNSLPMYIIKNIVARFNRFYKGLENTFGCSSQVLQLENGTQNTETKKAVLYVMDKDVYGKYATDCYGKFFENKILCSKVGIMDVDTYKSIYATAEEYDKQDSYFIEKMKKNLFRKKGR